MRRVEKTRGRDPAVSTEAFPLNRVPLCKRQSQFWTGSKTQVEKKKKKKYLRPRLHPYLHMLRDPL